MPHKSTFYTLNYMDNYSEADTAIYPQYTQEGDDDATTVSEYTPPPSEYHYRDGNLSSAEFQQRIVRTSDPKQMQEFLANAAPHMITWISAGEHPTNPTIMHNARASVKYASTSELIAGRSFIPGVIPGTQWPIDRGYVKKPVPLPELTFPMLPKEVNSARGILLRAPDHAYNKYWNELEMDEVIDGLWNVQPGHMIFSHPILMELSAFWRDKTSQAESLYTPPERVPQMSSIGPARGSMRNNGGLFTYEDYVKTAEYQRQGDERKREPSWV
ncbi:hypothetical protein BJ508DRAFT_321593 [Ascobolus immersus RN42]|uniref:Uncharacterized protein n=1 Tax=Ascobolus immersus RN42 TaxID=1160509 RepID=A0A3N4IP00_ASCIM|nr:hypothetical protein BJ508DRAFT_321593 [Ascobolus immersus RN42]